MRATRLTSAGWALLVTSASIAAACSDASPPALAEPPPPITEALRPHDVSILYPLPEPHLRTTLLGTNSEGARGPLLPQRLYSALPTIEEFVEAGNTYALLRVVSARLDPCFPTLDESAVDGCTPQLRLVFQPVLPVSVDEELVLTTVDAALHVFYRLSDEELDLTLRRVVAARQRALPNDTVSVLGPHPALLAEGPEGAFSKELTDALLDVAGEKNLTRITFMGVEGFGLIWRFGGFDVVGGELVPFAIPTVDDDDQIFSNADDDGIDFEGAFALPDVRSSDDIRLLFDSKTALTASREAQLEAYGAALRIESPDFHNPDTIDCVSCHVAASAHAWAEDKLGIDPTTHESTYRNRRGELVGGGTVHRTNRLRAFGYFARDVAISQRTANETEAVMAFLDARHGVDPR